MKQTTLTQRLLSALVALCMVLSVCAPALAAEPDGDWTSENDKNSKTFTFKMPEGDVSLRAEYRETYRIFETAGKAEFFAEGAEEQKIHEALPGTRIIAKVPDSELNDYRQFNMWRLVSEKELVEPDQNWQGKQSFRFTMPEGDVELQAFFTTLYDLTVNGGTIVDENGDTGTSKKIVKPGQLVTVRAESTEENPFLQWTYTGKAPAAPEGGWQTSKEFTFKMPEGTVTLEAQRDQLYKVSINDSLGSVTINGEPRSSLWVKEGDTVKRPVVWIAGGTDKGNDYEPLKRFAREKVHTLVCMGIDNRKLVESFTGIIPEIISTDSLDAAMQAARKASRPGDVVLLSPACASFDLFKNYENRGELFKQWVAEHAK